MIFVKRILLPFLLVYIVMAMAAATFAAPPQVATATAQLSETTLRPGEDAVVTVSLNIDSAYHVNTNPASEENLIPLTVSVSGDDISAEQPSYPAGQPKKFAFTPRPISVYEGAPEIRVAVRSSATAKAGDHHLNINVRYQACNDRACLMPQTITLSVPYKIAGAPAAALEMSTDASKAASTKDVAQPKPDAKVLLADAVALQKKYQISGLPTIVFLDAQGNERTDLRAGEELTESVMLQKLAALDQNTATSQTSGSAGSWLDKLQNAPLIFQLGLIFIGGLLLNLTPCVFPMIPVTVGYFGGQSEGRTGKTFILACFYVLGLALVYSALGMVAALTGSLFGSTLQSPWLLGTMAIVFLVLSASMFGLFVLNPPSFIMQRSGAKKGILGALMMGALLGIVAAPCVGPVVAALLVYVGAKANIAVGFLLFFVLSLGLGLPYLILGTLSGSIKSLPRSGAWMEKLKKFFAILLFLAACYYGYLAWNAFRPKPVNPAAAMTTKNVHWNDATLAAVEDAKRNGKSIVLDFRADWCLPCLKMEKEIFHQPKVLSSAANNNIQLMRVDLTRAG